MLRERNQPIVVDGKASRRIAAARTLFSPLSSVVPNFCGGPGMRTILVAKQRFRRGAAFWEQRFSERHCLTCLIVIVGGTRGVFRSRRKKKLCGTRRKVIGDGAFLTRRKTQQSVSESGVSRRGNTSRESDFWLSLVQLYFFLLVLIHLL